MSPQDSYMNELAENYQRELNIAKTSFAKDKSQKSIYKGVKDFYKRLDKQMARTIEKYNIGLACKKGCSHCCALRVEVFGYEVIALAKHIQESFSEHEIAAITDQLREASAKAKGLKPEDHFVPCALLKEGACSAYEMRPAMCRKFSSLSLEACLDNVQALENRGLKETTMAAFQGFVEGARHSGLKKTLYELNQALYIAITEASAGKRWISGTEVFPPIPPMIVERGL